NDVHGIAHITGGGLSNLLRLNDSVGFEIDKPLSPHPEFGWIQEQGGVTSWEMHRVFNMGMGIVLIVSNDAAEDVEKWVSGRIPGSQKIGYVVEGAGVHHSPLDLMYTEY
ncbi:MAG TPA: phosphoribosylformylglycinamidine cyclo-ligase, partial [Candidatus Poseidoniales archaeon]